MGRGEQANSMSSQDQPHEGASAPADTKLPAEKRWFPLESNPDLLNAYISKMGFDTSRYKFVDVFSTEEWAIDMIPQPVAAVIMLYPISEAQELHRAKEKAEVLPNQQVSDGVWHVAQRIGNACGTIGVLHSLGNLPDGVRRDAIAEGSWLDRFYGRCPRSLAPAEKAEILEADEEIERMHDDATADGANQTARGSIEDKVLTHFVALVDVDGALYELDGRKDAPVRHGDTAEATFLGDACKVVEAFMRRDPEEVRFTILALAPSGDGND